MKINKLNSNHKEPYSSSREKVNKISDGIINRLLEKYKPKAYYDIESIGERNHKRRAA